METATTPVELFARLGNEVRQTLHHMNGWIEMALAEPLSASQSECLARCRDSADDLLRRVNDLDELASPPGPPRPASPPFDLKEAVLEITDLMRALAAPKGLGLETSMDCPPLTVLSADRFFLQDTLRRIIENAIHFTGRGVVAIGVTASRDPEAPEAGGTWTLVFEVSDSGPGMPPDVIADLELPVSEPRLQGLGLRIVQKRIAGMGGTLSIGPGAGGGTLVRGAIPLTISAGAGAVHLSRDGTPAPIRLRVLVAEDSNDSFLLFQSFTRGRGHIVTRAMNGAEAVDMIKRGDYDFVVMDVNMPVMDGYTATRLVREWESELGRKRLPIVLISADTLERQMRIGGAAGCSGYLTKPTTKAQVLAAIDYYCDRPAGG